MVSYDGLSVDVVTTFACQFLHIEEELAAIATSNSLSKDFAVVGN